MNYRLCRCIGHMIQGKALCDHNPKVKVKKAGCMHFSLPEVSFCDPSLLGVRRQQLFVFTQHILLKQNAPPKTLY